jgi:hypothetical protein
MRRLWLSVLFAPALLALAIVVQSAIVTSEVVIMDPTADLQAAVDATPEGGTLTLGTGTFSVPEGGLVIDKSIVIQGSGTMGLGLDQGDDSAIVYGTILEPFAVDSAGEPVIVIEPPGGTAVLAYKGISVTIRGVTLNGSCTAFRSGSYGVVADLAALSILRHFKMEDCSVTRMGDDGIHLHGLDGAGSAVVGAYLDNVRAWANYGNGFYVKNTTSVNCTNASLFSNYKLGVYAHASGVRFYNCGFESNGRVTVVSEAEDAQLYGYFCNTFLVNGCHFENFDGATRGGFVYTSCKGITEWGCWGVSIDGNMFINGAFTPNVGAYGDEGPGTAENPIRTYNANQAILISQSIYGTPGHVGNNFFQGCYIGVSVSQATPEMGVYAADVYNQSYSWTGSCTVPFSGAAGFGLPKLDPIYVPDSLQGYANEPEQPSSEGLIYWDKTNHRIMVYDGLAWKTIALEADTVTVAP